MKWSHLRRGQLDAIDRRTPVVLPVGATEQHGEHLPLATDRMIIEAVVERLDAALEDRLLILPTQHVGCSEHHMKFPGSLTLTHETFAAWAAEVVDSVVRHGFKRIVVLNGHGGNRSICAVLSEQIGQRYPDVECLVGTWWSVAADRLEQLQEGPVGSVGHACEFETSIIQAVAPELVDVSSAADGGPEPRTESMRCDLLRNPVASFYQPFDVLSPSGVFGKPSLASPEKGRRILEVTVEALRELITEFWPDFRG